MLELTIKKGEAYDESKGEFRNLNKDVTLTLEHSLVSISKWESKWKIPFLSETDKTTEQTIDYIKCMTITQNVDPLAYEFLSASNLAEVQNYISDPMTATTFGEDYVKIDKPTTKKQVITAELIYYYMVALNIPFECQKWHISKLLTLIRICNIKNAGEKQVNKNDIIARNRALNAQRRAKYKTTG